MHLLYPHPSSPSSTFPHLLPPLSVPSSPFPSFPLSRLPVTPPSPSIQGHPAPRSCSCIVDPYSNQAFLHHPPTAPSPIILVVFQNSPFHLDGDIRIASRIPRKIPENPHFPQRSSESTSFIDSWHWIADRRSPHARVGEVDEKRGRAVLDLLYKSRELIQSFSSHHSLTSTRSIPSQYLLNTFSIPSHLSNIHPHHLLSSLTWLAPLLLSPPWPLWPLPTQSLTSACHL